MQSPAETGARLDHRYRLVEQRPPHPSATLWRATDETLGRPVAIRILTGSDASDPAQVTAAAAMAGGVADARWVRVLDIGSESADAATVIWVVSEWVEAPSLATIVRNEPLSGPIATGLILACAQAVAAAHRQGVHHGGLHPDEVLLPADGNPRLTGLERGLYGHGSPPYDDTLALGALLFTALTGRWPLPGWPGLPAASRGDGTHPRRYRRGVSRELDEITAKALAGGYPDPGSFANELAELPTAPLHPAPRDPEERRNSPWRRWAWRIVPPLLVIAIGFAAWTAGSVLGRIPSPARVAAPAFPQPEPSAGTTASHLVWSRPPHITSFDPEGDGAEDPGGVGLAVDDDPSTSWLTDTYRGNAQFGGLKDGVGLLLDLHVAKTVRVAQLLLSAPGASFQIRAGATVPKQASDLPVVATASNSPAAVRLTLAKPVTARYWLVWFTSLPPSKDSNYQLGVAEISLQN